MHVGKDFEVLQKHTLFLKKSKCSFAEIQVEYLGHVNSNKGVELDPSKVKVIEQWPSPTSIKELHSFLGLFGYYRRFINQYGSIAKPLTDLLRKGTTFT